MTTRFGENFWDERYSAAGQVWSGKVNPQLAADAQGLPPGRAFDAGCGEGADALWLAQRGWTVRAVDFSQVALDKAAAHEAQAVATSCLRPGRISWEQHDLLTWTPPKAAFDLVTAAFMHLPTISRDPLYARLAQAVAPGGTLLLVGHSATDARAGARRPDNPDLYFTARQLGSSLDPALWEIQSAQARPRHGEDAAGAAITIHDEVLRARRLP